MPAGCAAGAGCGRRTGESGSQTGRGGVAERGGACPGCGLKEKPRMASGTRAVGGLEGVGSRLGGAVLGAIVAESVGYGTAAAWEQTKQLGAVDMSRGDADATRQRASVEGCGGGWVRTQVEWV